jgi:hypothetical protein
MIQFSPIPAFCVECYGREPIEWILLLVSIDVLLCTPPLRFGITKWLLLEAVKPVSRSPTLFRNAASDLSFSRKIGLATHGISSDGTAFA